MSVRFNPSIRAGARVRAALQRRAASRYGCTAHEILRNILTKIPWQFTAKSVFGGTGSMGTGDAMRATPLGPYFADDIY